MSTSIMRGQKMTIDKNLLTLNTTLNVVIELSLPTNNDEINVSCFGLDAGGTLSNEQYFIFYNQTLSPCGSIRLEPARSRNITWFKVKLAGLPTAIHRLVFTAVIDGPSTMSKLERGSVNVSEPEGKLDATFQVNPVEFGIEKSLMLVELYKKDGQWRLGAVGQGFKDGLNALIRHFGGQVTDRTPVVPSVPLATIKPVVPPAPLTPLVTKISLEKKVEHEAPHLISLAKKATISLEKLRLTDVQARVALVLDASGSMYDQYVRNDVQAVVDRIIPLAVHFDDDGESDTWAFAEKANKMAPVTLKNVKGYVEREKGGWLKWMRTLDARHNNEPAVMTQVIEYFTKTKLPAYVVFISDGGIYKHAEIQRLLIKSSKMPIFWQFVGIGGSDYGVLEDLDSMKGRFVDNANFFALDDLRSVSDAQLYDRLLAEFPQWLLAISRLRLL